MTVMPGFRVGPMPFSFWNSCLSFLWVVATKNPAKVSRLALQSRVPYTPAIAFSWHAVHTGRLHSEDVSRPPSDPNSDPNRNRFYCMLTRPQRPQAEILS